MRLYSVLKRLALLNGISISCLLLFLFVSLCLFRILYTLEFPERTSRFVLLFGLLFVELLPMLLAHFIEALLLPAFSLLSNRIFHVWVGSELFR